MKIVSFFFLLFVVTNASAQKKPKTIQLDTIHLRGYIYDEAGKPIRGIGVFSKRSYPEIDKGYYINNYSRFVYTDTAGYFELNGAQTNDTLYLSDAGTYDINQKPVYNKGSRYMVIYLSTIKPTDKDTGQTIQIQAVRTHAQKSSSVKLSFDTSHNIEWPEDPHIHSFFRGGTRKFNSLIQSKISYPQKAIDNNIEGTVQIGFTVEKDSSIAGITILKGIGYGCDQQVIDALKQSPKWLPAINMGRGMTTTHSVTVEFKLTDK